MTTTTPDFTADGGCACGAVRYRLSRRPMFVNCCHCRWCQRESGAAFALNATIESANIHLLAAPPVAVETPSQSGRGQRFLRCAECQVALWSHYGSAREALSWLRVGTLDNPDLLPPDAHIFTNSKQPWLLLPDHIATYSERYDQRKTWPAASLARLEAALAAKS